MSTTTLPADAVVHRARTVEEAVQQGLEHLAIGSEDAQITVLDRGSRGFLGLGARRAEVAIAPKTPLIEPVVELAEELLGRMQIPARVTGMRRGRVVHLRVEAGELDGLLIGRRGETLEALQHVIARLAGRRLGSRLETAVVDVGGYRERREQRLQELAQNLAERVERTGRRTMTEALSATERRVIHRALDGRSGIRTHTGGSGAQRRVVITARRDATDGD